MNTIRIRYAALPLALVLLLGMTQTGCSSMSRTGSGAIIGAGSGAVIGGVIGRATGSTARGAIIGAAVGGAAGAVIGRQMDRQAAELERELENARVTPIEGEDGNTGGIAVLFDNALLFDLNSSTLRSGVQADLRDLAMSMQNYAGHDLVIVGHASTDGSDATNQSLSERRASAVANFLAAQGVDRSRMQNYGRGETEPLAGIPGTDPANRRVEVAIYPSDSYRSQVESEYGG
jgi:outer membrane protein OmpA-like peptidoglycan-associated protein